MLGRILSNTDSVPLYNAQIYLINKNIGTTSNGDGWFKLNIPNEYKNELLMVSSLGYHNFSISSSESKKDTTYIYLRERITVLDEVTDTNVDGKRIVEKAVVKMAENYPKGKILNDIHYKEIVKVDSNYIRYLEIAADFVSNGFDNSMVGKENYKEVFLKGKRTSYNYDSTFSGQNGLFIVYWLNRARSLLTKEALKSYEYEYEGITTYNEKSAFKISLVRPNSSAKAVLYISTEEYAIIGIDYYLDNDTQDKPKGKEKWWFLKLRLHVDFRKVGNVWYVNSIDDLRKEKNNKGQIFESWRTIRVLNVSDTKNLPFTHKIKPETNLFNYPLKYDSSFWKTYNGPLETENEILIKEKMERNRIKLDDQFKK
jgi:hypothetical protein